MLVPGRRLVAFGALLMSAAGWYGTFHIQVPMFEKINKQSFEEEAFKTVDLLFRMVNCRCTELVIAVGTQ